MIRFLITGLLRDKSRSRLPVMVVAIGVMLTIFIHAYITGFMGDTIEMNARFTHGHLKVMTSAYANNVDQVPNDLALIEVEELAESLRSDYPGITWTPRIRFGGLVDVPDAHGETRTQGPAAGMAFDFLSGNSAEAARLNIEKALVRGRMIRNQGEALLSDVFASRLNVKPGQEVTLIGSTMNGSMAFYNFVVAGTLSFGAEALDRGSIIVDLADAQYALDMEDAAGELLGFLENGYYDDQQAINIAASFNTRYNDPAEEFSPVMKSLSQQGSMGTYVAMSKVWSWYISAVFIFAMALVLWNAGLLGGLRRYGEFGLRLAMGEEKGHVYRTLIGEAVLVGLAGTVIGTAAGLGLAWLLQTYGMDISGLMEGASLMFPSTIRARITPMDYYLGFIPGLVSTVVGAMLAGIGIYRRKTSQLFKELEA